MERLKQPYFIYLIVISLVGGLIISAGLRQLPTYLPFTHFLLFLLLAISAQLITASFPISDKAGITYQVAPAVSLAVIPFFGPFAAVLVDAVSALSLWLIKPSDRTNWKKSWPQLAFNTGMGSIAVFLAASTFIFVQNSLGGTVIGLIVAWLTAAVVNDQVNLLLLVGILWLQHKRKISPKEIWIENLWAMPISILLMSVGGALLAYSLKSYGPIGLGIFFLPILLSAIAFHFYVKKKQEYMRDLEQKVQERTRELENLNKRKDAFLAVLTHDMITPLTTIRLYSELIKEDPTTPAEDPEFIETMIRCQRHLHTLLQNILDLEKLNNGEDLHIQKKRINVTGLLRVMISIVQVEAKEKNILIEPLLEDTAVYIHADKNQTERIFLNLLSNAVKYTPVNGEITVSLAEADESIQVKISDNGYGIPEVEMPFIFQRFSRVRELKDKATGTGLGLAITKALVEAHGGQILANSVEGVGSTFTTILPKDTFQDAQPALELACVEES